MAYYTPIARYAAPIDGSDPLPQLQTYLHKPGRLWIVLSTGRAGHAPEVQQLLGEHCKHVAHFSKRRFDAYDYTIDIFLREAPATKGGAP